MSPKVIDLRSKPVASAKRIMKRFKAFKDDKGIQRPLHFLLPKKEKVKKRDSFEQNKLRNRCPYCQSSLVESEAGIVCTSENLKNVVYEIETVRRHPLYKKNPELYLTNRANRYYGYYMLMGRSMTCDYILGNEEHRFRINNRLLRPGIDRKTIKK